MTFSFSELQPAPNQFTHCITHPNPLATEPASLSPSGPAEPDRFQGFSLPAVQLTMQPPSLVDDLRITALAALLIAHLLVRHAKPLMK